MEKTKLMKLTGLYNQESKQGKKYFQGSFKLGVFEGFLKLFPVENKATEKSPDYNLTVDYKDNALGLIRLGGLWKQKDKDGNTYLSGRLGSVYVKVLKNTFKEKDTDPDFNLFFSQIIKDEASKNS
jgi:uncharacterized protein (DUF736 family)